MENEKKGRCQTLEELGSSLRMLLWKSSKKIEELRLLVEKVIFLSMIHDPMIQNQYTTIRNGLNKHY